MTVVKKKLLHWNIISRVLVKSNPFSKQNPNYMFIMNTGVNKFNLCLPSGSSAVHMSQISQFIVNLYGRTIHKIIWSRKYLGNKSLKVCYNERSVIWYFKYPEDLIRYKKKNMIRYRQRNENLLIRRLIMTIKMIPGYYIGQVFVIYVSICVRCRWKT